MLLKAISHIKTIAHTTIAKKFKTVEIPIRKDRSMARDKYIVQTGYTPMGIPYPNNPNGIVMAPFFIKCYFRFSVLKFQMYHSVLYPF